MEDTQKLSITVTSSGSIGLVRNGALFMVSAEEVAQISAEVKKAAKPKEYYTDSEVTAPSFLAIIEEARQLWKKLIDKALATKGDWGTCVLGAGFTVSVRHHKRRSQDEEIVLRPPTGAQGCCTWETSKDEVMAFLVSRGIRCDYEYGRMD